MFTWVLKNALNGFVKSGLMVIRCYRHGVVVPWQTLKCSARRLSSPRKFHAKMFFASDPGKTCTFRPERAMDQ